mgnify:CR=1 FL=1
MATNKHAIIRYQALDRCFRNTARRYYIDDLIEACNQALYEFEGVEEGVKRRQIYDDIRFMESEQGYSIPLEKIRDGKRVFYRYSDPNFSINKEPLNEAEAEQLKEALLTLNRFKGMPQFEWVNEMITRLQSSFNLVKTDKQIIEFEHNPFLQGLEHITNLYYAISYEKVLVIRYQGFKQEKEDQFYFHPYYLKQYNNRWFVFGLHEELGKIANLALDRIKYIEEVRQQYKPTDIDFEEYFEDVVGVTIPDDGEVQKILLSVDLSLFAYIESKPIHGSQKIKERKDDSALIELELIPNYEFESLILSYGSKIKILEPVELAKRMKNSAEQIKLNYDV